MSRRLAMLVALLLVPGAARAEDAPERLLPAGTQLYLRWDGLEDHQASYARTALGKMMQEDTGKFLAVVYQQIQAAVGESLTVPQVLGGLEPDQLQQIQEDVVEAPKLLPVLTRRGLVIAAEVRSIQPPQAQLTLILPGAGVEPRPFLSAMRLAAVTSKQKTKESKIDGAVVTSIEAGPVQLVWWIDAKDAVLVVGTDKPEAVVQRARQKTDRLADNPQFQKVRDFKGFETALRGFLDTAALVKLGRAQGKEVAQVIDDLGLTGLQGVRYYLGFDLPAERGLIEVDLPGPRKGLFKFADSKPFSLADLPPLPSDAVSFAAVRFDLGSLYDRIVKAAESIAGAISPLAPAAVHAALIATDAKLGLSLRHDLIGSLGDLVVMYNSPIDGPVNLGTVALLRVKDEAKLAKALEQLSKALAELSGANLKVHKRNYHGAELRELYVKSQGFVFLPTYTIHKGWLAIGMYPQPVQGFVLRTAGELPVWKAGPDIVPSLDRLPKEFAYVSVSDPRPTVKQVLSVAPFIGASIRSFSPESKFDVGALPHGEMATRHLFPNVSVGTDDGTTLRIQSRTSLQLPFDAVGIDSYFGGLFLATVIRFAN
jgi:hypothetical protein